MVQYRIERGRGRIEVARLRAGMTQKNTIGRVPIIAYTEKERERESVCPSPTLLKKEFPVASEDDVGSIPRGEVEEEEEATSDKHSFSAAASASVTSIGLRFPSCLAALSDGRPCKELLDR